MGSAGSKSKNTDPCCNVKVVKCPSGCMPQYPVYNHAGQYNMPPLSQPSYH